jgi:CHAT domain-containing protein
MSDPQKTDRQTQTALVSFYLGDAETLIFWLDAASTQTEVERAPVRRDEIAAAAETLRELFSRIHHRRPERTTNMAWLEPLGAKLLRPLEARLKRCDALVVAPHAELHLLPLHLLALEGAPPLGVTHSISYVASLSLYALLLGRHLEAPERLTVPALCLSTAAREDDALRHETFATAARAFAEKSGGLFQQGIEASRWALRQYAETAACLYLSCHGRFDDNDPLESELLLSDGRTLPGRPRPASKSSTERAWTLADHQAARDQGESSASSHGLSVRDILNLRVRSRLVVLDACMSGHQRFSPGDEPMGFPTAFLLAGASALIASNWVVEQNCGRDFHTTLLDHWISGQSSLGMAMQEAYAITRAKYPHPFHWAAFSLFGNERLRFWRN